MYFSCMLKGYEKTIELAAKYLNSKGEEFSIYQEDDEDLPFIKGVYLNCYEDDFSEVVAKFPSLKACCWYCPDRGCDCDAQFSDSGESELNYRGGFDYYDTKSEIVPFVEITPLQYCHEWESDTRTSEPILYEYKCDFLDEWSNGIYKESEENLEEMQKALPEGYLELNGIIKLSHLSIKGSHEECEKVAEYLDLMDYKFKEKPYKNGSEIIDLNLRKRITKIFMIELMKKFPKVRMLCYGKTKKYNVYKLLLKTKGSKQFDKVVELEKFSPTTGARAYMDRSYTKEKPFPFKEEWHNA